MRLEGLAHLSAIENALHLYSNISKHYNQTALEDLNNIMFKILAPAIAVLVLTMAVGVIGNFLICFIFMLKMKTSAQNTLLLSLGIFDLLSCCIGVPAEIYDMRHYFLYDSVTACKTLRYLTISPTLASILILLVIALERYRKICYPLRQQFEASQVRLIVVAIMIISLVLAVPSLFLYGHRSFKTGIPNLYGNDCSIDDNYKDGVFPLIYEILIAAAFSIATLILISVYLRILIETRRHTKYMRKHAILGGVEDKTISVCNESDLVDAKESTSTTTKPDSDKLSWTKIFQRKRTKFALNVSDKTVDNLATEKIIPDPDIQPSMMKDQAYLCNVIYEKCSETAQICVSHSAREKNTLKDRVSTEKSENEIGYKYIKEFDDRNGNPRNDRAVDDEENSPIVNLEAHERIDPDEKFTTNQHKSPPGKFSMASIDTKESILSESASKEACRNDLPKKALSNTNCDHKEAIGGRLRENSPSRNSISTQLKLTRQQSLDIIKYESDEKQTKGQSDQNTSQTFKSAQSLYGMRVRKAVTSRRATVIAFTITFGFILSYFPHITLIILRSVITDFEHDLNEASMVFYNIFLRSYLANNVINVFVYGAMNLQFRMQLRKLTREFKIMLCRGCENKD